MTLAAVAVAVRGREARQVLATSGASGSRSRRCAVWAAVVTPDIVGYFSPAVHRGIEQLTGLATTRAAAPASSFTKSTTPAYEQRAGYLAPTSRSLLAVTGIWAIRRRLLPQDAALLGLAALRSAVFRLIPVHTHASGAEGARRSWAFTSLGLCLAWRSGSSPPPAGRAAAGGPVPASRRAWR